MPRVSPKTEVENVEKTTTRRRAAPKKVAAKKTTTKSDPKKTTRKAPVKRKTAAKKKPAGKEVTEPMVETEQTEVTSELQTIATSATTNKKRKAPTAFANEIAKQRALRNQAIVIGLLLVVGIGASAAVGFTDSKAGQINVAQTIKERNERMANMVDVAGPVIVAPTPARNNLPDGGFVASTRQPVPSPTPAATASSTASSTNPTATSTADGVESDDVTDTTALEAESTTSVPTTDIATTTVTATNQTEQNTSVIEPEPGDPSGQAAPTSE